MLADPPPGVYEEPQSITLTAGDPDANVTCIERRHTLRRQVEPDTEVSYDAQRKKGR